MSNNDGHRSVWSVLRYFFNSFKPFKPFKPFKQSLGISQTQNTLQDTLQHILQEITQEQDHQKRTQTLLLLRNIIRLQKRTVIDCMVPRVDIVAVHIDTPLSGVIEIFQEMSYSRIPVYQKTRDEMIGIIHIKDVFGYLARNENPSLENMIRHVRFVVPSMLASDLLLQMRQTHQHMAFVVDEFGDIDGLVTIEDLVEEIVGDIFDEHDVSTRPHLTPMSDGTYLADARASVQTLEECITLSLLENGERDEIDTLGGLVFSLAGRIPTSGETFSHPKGIEFEILEADPRRIKSLRIRPLPMVSDPPL